MYISQAFRVDEESRLHDLLRQRPLATLLSSGSSGLQVSPLPMLFDAAAGTRGALFGHMARANPQLQDLRAGAPCLVLFHGPQGYVSPSWYPSKARHHQVVPTWNYAVVEVRGQAQVIDDPRWLRDHVDRLTASQEARRAEPWSPADAPPEFIDRMLAMIVGVRIDIASLEGKFKFSQNREPADRAAVLAALDRAQDPHGNPELAAWMRACLA